MTKLLMTDEIIELWKEGVRTGYKIATGKDIPADDVLSLAAGRFPSEPERKVDPVPKRPAYLDKK